MGTSLKRNLDSLQEKARERTVKTQNVEYDLESLIKRIKKGSIKLNPDYQRRHRWPPEVSSKLVESLLLNIPIPVIFISQDVDVDEETEEEVARYTVIDGQQRLTALYEFMTGDLELVGLETLSEINGCTINDLPSFLLRRLDERTIKCLRIDSTADPQVKYDIFERLNTGSVKLEPQELRNAVTRGPFNDAIKELAKNKLFRRMLQIPEVNPEENSKIKKMEDVELVLRFFALKNGGYKESRKIGFKDFLTKKMEQFNKLKEGEIEAMKSDFNACMTIIYANLGSEAFSKSRVERGEVIKRMSRFNAAVFDAISVGLMESGVAKDDLANTRIRKGSIRDVRGNIINQEKVYELFEEREFFESVSGSVNDHGKINYRIDAVIEVLKQ